MPKLTARQFAEKASGLTTKEKKIVEIILSEFTRAGLPSHIAIAAVANARGESYLDPTEVGDGGDSIGLFQANVKAGAGRGHSKSALKNPYYNTRVIIAEAKRDGKSLLNPAHTPNVANAIAFFVSEVERPANKGLATSQRINYHRKMFPWIPLNAGPATIPVIIPSALEGLGKVKLAMATVTLLGSVLLLRQLR